MQTPMLSFRSRSSSGHGGSYRFTTHPTFEVRYGHEPVRMRHRYLNVDRFESLGWLFLNQLARPETFCLDRRTSPQLPVNGDRWGGNLAAASRSVSSCCRFLRGWIMYRNERNSMVSA